jgi:hypothetical protein
VAYGLPVAEGGVFGYRGRGLVGGWKPSTAEAEGGGGKRDDDSGGRWWHIEWFECWFYAPRRGAREIKLPVQIFNSSIIQVYSSVNR